jgi:ribosomal-protein-alanine N-acetyltransferase
MDAGDLPELRTERCLLRRIRPADITAVFRGLSDPRVIANYGVRFGTLEDTRVQMDWYARIEAEGSGRWWAVCEPYRPDELIGAVGLNDIVARHRRGEVGYWLLPQWWSRGLATECLAAVVEHAFGAMALHRLAAEVDVGHVRSAAVLRRLGFRLEGVRRGWEIKDGRHLDLEVYSRLATDPAPG